jgi:hypothetical protein
MDGPVPLMVSSKLSTLDGWHFQAVKIRTTFEQESDKLLSLCPERSCSRTLLR